MIIYQCIITVIIFVLLLNTLINMWLLRRPVLSNPPKNGPFISILVPARNEANKIRRCIESLVHQTYTHREILVLDDHSEDETATIIAELAYRYPEVRLLHGQLLPTYWHGKAFACMQLAHEARGDWLLFVDADTVYQPHALASVLAEAESQKADLVTLLPHIELGSWGEALLLPIIPMLIRAIFPHGIVSSRYLHPVAGALGPFLLFRRTIYERIGGHASVRTDIVEDMKLGRLVKRYGGKVVWLDGVNLMSVRFYNGFSETWRGLGKSTFAALNNSLSALLAALFAATLIFVLPYSFVIINGLQGQFDLFLFWFPVIQILEIWSMQILIMWRCRLPPILAFTHGIMMISIVLFGLTSAYQTTFGNGVTWKGRTYAFSSPQATKFNPVILPIIRIGLSILLALAGWHSNYREIPIIAILVLMIWSIAIIEHYHSNPSKYSIDIFADGAFACACLFHLMINTSLSIQLIVSVLAISAIVARFWGWRATFLLASLISSSVILVTYAESPHLTKFVVFWLAIVIFCERRRITQTIDPLLHWWRSL
jgi:chlorobactene glucosyltransferase